MMKIFIWVLLLGIVSLNNANCAQLPPGMCRLPFGIPAGTSSDSVEYFFCTVSDVPKDEVIRDSLVKALIKSNSSIVWFEMNVLKDGIGTDFYNDPLSYKPYLFGYIDENNKMFIHRAYKYDKRTNDAMKRKLRDQYDKIKQIGHEKALQEGRLQYKTVRPQTSQEHGSGIDPRMQPKINNLERRLRGF